MKYKILLITGVLIGTVGQVLMKQGVRTLGGVSLSAGGLPAEIFRIFTNPYVLVGLVFVGLSFMVWITVISKLDLSFAYPFVGISYILILMFGHLLYREHVNLIRVGGVGLIAAGIVLIARTGSVD